MIPLRDENPSSTVPAVTRPIIALNVVAVVYEATRGSDLREFMFQWAFVPARLTQALHGGEESWIAPSVTLVTSMFLHGGWAHLGGMLAFAVVFGAWQIPFSLRLGWEGVREIWAGEVLLRFVGHTVGTVAAHLAAYPFESVIAILPWSLLLSCFCFRGFRDRLADARSPVAFLTIPILIAFPTVWLAPGARGRYLMPLYPCIAVLVGLVVQRCSEAPAGTPWRRVTAASRSGGRSARAADRGTVGAARGAVLG